MQHLLKKHPHLIKLLHMYWATYSNWTPLVDENELINNEDEWKKRKNEFNLVADSFLKHGEGMGYTLDEYIFVTLHCFNQIRRASVVDLFKANNLYPSTDELFALKLKADGEVEHKFEVKAIREVFISANLHVPKLEFAVVRSSRNVHLTCSLSEIKCAFDPNLSLIDFLEIVCDCSKQSSTITEGHMVGIFTNVDRSTHRK